MEEEIDGSFVPFSFELGDIFGDDSGDGAGGNTQKIGKG